MPLDTPPCTQKDFAGDAQVTAALEASFPKLDESK
jgi:hypothetical protein